MTGPVFQKRRVPHVFVTRRTARLTSAASVIVLMAALTAFQAAGTRFNLLPLQLAFLTAFCSLTAVDFSLAGAVGVFELVLGGAGGRWTVFPGGISGRIVVDAVLVIAALTSARRHHRALARDTYLVHALAVAVLFGGVWLTLGFIEGHPRSYVVQDGDGLLFFGFAVVIVVLIAEAGTDWVRRLLLCACIVNAFVIAALDLVAATHLVALRPTLDDILGGRLQFGGIIGVLPDGSSRFSPGNAFYLQVGVALVTSALLRRPRHFGLWFAYVVLWTGVLMSYTRGYWAGAVIAVVLTLILASNRSRNLGIVLIGNAVLACAAVASLAIAGFSLRSYVADRVLGTGGGGVSSTVATSASGWYRPFLHSATAPNAEHGAPNLIVNPGFQKGVAGWYSVPGGSIVSSKVRAHTGTASAQLLYGGGPDFNLGYYPIRLPPAHVTVSAWVFVSPSVLRSSVALEAELFDRSTGVTRAQVKPGRVNRWQRLTLSFWPSPTDLLGAIVFRATTQPPRGFRVSVDDIQVTAGFVANGSFERNARGWRAGPSGRIARTTALAHTGEASAKIRFLAGRQDDNVAYTTLALAAAPTEVSLWLYLPRSWPRSAMVALSAEGFEGETGQTIAVANENQRGAWQPLKLAFAPSADDVVGHLVVRIAKAASGGTVEIDDVVARPEVPSLNATAGDLVASEGGPSRLSDQIRIRQSHVLWSYIAKKPIAGYGFGAVAHELRPIQPPCVHPWQCNPPYSYELSYLDLAFKTGVLGLLLFFSFHVRVLLDAIRIRFGRRNPPSGMSRYEAGAVLAITCSILATGATNPYVLAAFGLFPLLAAVAWVDVLPADETAGHGLADSCSCS